MSDEPNDPTITQEQVVEAELTALRNIGKADPSQIPTQFAGDVEKWVSSHKELRSAYTKSQQELAALKKGAPAADVTPPKADAAPQPDGFFAKPEAPAADAGIPWGVIQQEIRATGQISDTTRKSLTETYKVPAEVIALHERAFKLEQQAMVSKAAELAGGQEQLNSMIKYVQTSMSESERVAINEAMAKPGWETVLLGVKAKMAGTKGGEPGRVGGGQASGTDPAPKAFRSEWELARALNDPRYNNDTEYTAAVQARMVAVP